MSHFTRDRMTGDRDETNAEDVARTRPFGQTRYHHRNDQTDEELDRVAEPGEGTEDRCAIFNRQLRGER